MYWMTFLWPCPKVTAVALINKNLLVCRMKWEPLNQSLQNLVAISLLVMLIPWLDFEGILVKYFYFAKFRMGFFKVKHSIGHITGMVGSIDVEQKGGALVGYWVNYVTLTFDLTHDLDLWFFKVKFQTLQKSCSTLTDHVVSMGEWDKLFHRCENHFCINSCRLWWWSS